MGQQAIWAVLTAVSYSTLILGATIFFARAEVPRSMPFMYWGVLLLGIGGTRLVVRAYYHAKLRSLSENVIIYGAGQSGRQLLHALQHGEQYHPVAFVDDETGETSTQTIENPVITADLEARNAAQALIDGTSDEVVAFLGE